MNNKIIKILENKYQKVCHLVYDDAIEINIEEDHIKGEKDKNFKKELKELLKDLKHTKILINHCYSERYDGFIGATFEIKN